MLSVTNGESTMNRKQVQLRYNRLNKAEKMRMTITDEKIEALK